MPPDSAAFDWPCPFEVGEHFRRELMFDSETIRAFSRAALDPNPLHLDDAVAAASRFGGLIASGTQSMAWLMGSLGAWVLERCPSLGLDCDFKLRRAVPADRLAVVAWEVISLRVKPALNGHIMQVRGSLSDLQGEVMVAANANILLLKDMGMPPGNSSDTPRSPV